ncbi:amino acid ABC transporter [Haematobacter missouriensis]|uniref:Amino acid ABC transporter n=1 Tax=Haematobacter missouriensis TaxID=366616 RepID=A0A212AX06_9RHOB|nr:transporter substrate-binding domain-containing protein [Haematobacter missouriensis]KFI34009.1 amino acid ABC transporter [Haematobacter missouriensis]OWJ78248.1 amino acid ABC transporter [Haematobacter missouriensis]OWJ85998.1 amino acid ABC transporter [Haematobacter missouriensis]
MKKIAMTAAVLASMAGSAFAQQVVRIGTEGAYAPYNFINDSGKLDGYEIELGGELCKRLSLTCEFVQNDWDTIMANLNSGNYDLIMAGMSITEERKKDRLFTQNYTPPTVSLYVAASENVDVKKGIVAAQTATIQAQHVAESGATLVEFATPDETVSAVRNGEADAVLADLDYLKPIAEQSNGELVIVDRVQLGEGVGAAFRMSDAALRDRFDGAIAEMKKDGSINKLIVKWFGDDAAVY